MMGMRRPLAIAMLVTTILAPTLAAQPAAEWRLIGYRQLRAASGETVMHIDPSEGRFARVRFQAQERGVVVDSVRFELQEGEPIEVRPRQRISAGQEGEPIDLGDASVVLRARIHYRLLGSRGAATLNLLGEPPTP